MLYRRIDFEYETERSKGIENWTTMGDYLSYDMVSSDYKKYYEDLIAQEEQEEPKGNEDTEGYESVEDCIKAQKEQGHMPIADIRVEKRRIKNSKDFRKDTQRQNFPVIDMSTKDEKSLVELREKKKCDDIDSNPLGTAMVDFLNFDFDEYIEGEYEIRLKYGYDNLKEKQVIEGFDGWNKLNNHDLSNRMNRHEVLYDFIYGANITGPNENSEQQIPFFVRMFSSLFVDFNNWTYKEEGFKLLEKYQRKFSKILDNYYGLDIDGKKDKRLAFERYCDTYGLKYGSSKEAKKSKLEIRKLANQALEFVNSKIWVISPTETEEVLDQVLWAEFYAMISKDNLYLRKCESCYKYYLGSPNSKYCKGESKVNYFKDEDGNDFILEMSQCAVVTTMNNYNNMKKSNSIVEVYYNEKRRLEHCLDHFQCNVEEIYIYNLFDVLKKTREANEDNYVKKYKADESIDNRRMLIEEYRKLLIDAVNDELKRVSPEQYKTRNFDRMRYKDTNKDK